MKTRYIWLALCLPMAFSACKKDEIADVVASFRIESKDKEGNLIQNNDVLYVNKDITFINTGQGDAFVVWPGERAVTYKNYSYLYTSESEGKLTEQAIPQDVIETISPLLGLQVLSFKNFYTEMGKLLTAPNLTKYEGNIMMSALFPFKDVNGKDSIRFSINNCYDDYLQANNKGFYGITGVALSKAGGGRLQCALSLHYFWQKENCIYCHRYWRLGIGEPNCNQRKSSNCQLFGTVDSSFCYSFFRFPKGVANFCKLN